MPPVKTPKRLTRDQQREQTRTKLIDAAATVFAERGFHGASVEEIAERAGYTRGAFYSNFADKDDVFFAVYDKRLASQIQEVSALLRESADPAAFFTSIRQLRMTEPSTLAWTLLQQEFLLYALRNPAVRPKFAERYRHVREQYERAITSIFDALDLEVPGPVEDLAVIVDILSENTVTLHHLDPAGVRKGFFFDALALLFEAGVALAEKRTKS